MDTEERVEVFKSTMYEIITEDELRDLFETKTKILAYDGFEPSGLAHLPFAVYRPLILRELMKANVDFILLLADSFAWINNKMEGDIEKIRKTGEYFVEVWKAAGVDMNKVKVVWHKDFMGDEEYWKKVILIAKNHTLQRTLRALTIAGRVGALGNPSAFSLYPSMQAADIFHLGVDICQLGIDQRKVNILAREVSEKLGWKKPIIASHNLLMDLQGPVKPQKMDEDERRDVMITSKMSKSKPETAIIVHDTKEDIERKIMKAYAPPKQVEDNPILQYFKEIVFRVKDRIIIKRDKKFGGDVEFLSYNKMEEVYREGKLHPLDAKKALAEEINQLITPIREHFEKNKRARELYDFVKSVKITR